MVTRTIGANGSIELVASGARTRITRLRPGIVLLTQIGDDEAMTRATAEELEQEIQRSGRLTIFVDVRGVPHMSSGVRDFSLSWGRLHRPEVERATILVGSKVVGITMSLLAMVLGGGLIKVVSDARTFEELVRDKVPEFGVLPESPAPSASAEQSS
jgi:hypothetical protein